MYSTFIFFIVHLIFWPLLSLRLHQACMSPSCMAAYKAGLVETFLSPPFRDPTTLYIPAVVPLYCCCAPFDTILDLNFL
jgi:hypothetical protein